MKKKLLFIFGLLAIGIFFDTITEANAKELDGPECPAGGFTKLWGYWEN